MSINTPNNPNKFVEQTKEEISKTSTIKELKNILTNVQAENLKGNINDDEKDEIDQVVLERASTLGFDVNEFITQGQEIGEVEELTDLFRPVDFSEPSEVDPFTGGIELPEINLPPVSTKKSDYDKCLNELEDFSGMLDHNQLLNIFNSNFENAEQKEELYALWIEDLIKTSNEDRIESSLKEIISENPNFNEDLKLIIDLLPNLNSSDKEKLHKELLGDIGTSKDNLQKEDAILLEDNNDLLMNDPFYINTADDKPQEAKETNFEEDINDENTVQEEVRINKNTPQKTRSVVRNSILAAVGIIAVVGLGVYKYNENKTEVIPVNTSSIQENKLSEETIDGGIAEETVDADVIEETIDAEVAEETVDAEVSKETVDAEVAEETVDTEVAEETVDAEVAEETVDAEVAEETVDAEVAEETLAEAVEDKKTIKIPFLKEESINMTFVPKTTIYGDTMINFDSSIKEWEKDGWEAVEAFYHSPTKRGWVLKNEDQVVFILQQIIEKGEDSVLAYVQPKTW